MVLVSRDVKESVLQKALNRGSKTLKEIAEENGVGYSTLTKWLYMQKKDQMSRTKQTASEKFKHLQSVASLNDEEKSSYCRQHGLYPFQLTEWENEFKTDKISSSNNKYKLEVQELRQKNKELERELRRKDKALAEAAAIIVLKKKAQMLWAPEDDSSVL